MAIAMETEREQKGMIAYGGERGEKVGGFDCRCYLCVSQ